MHFSEFKTFVKACIDIPDVKALVEAACIKPNSPSYNLLFDVCMDNPAFKASFETASVKPKASM